MFYFKAKRPTQPEDVVALHCTLSSGKQWRALKDSLGKDFNLHNPNISGYGRDFRPPHFPATLESEVELLESQLATVRGRFHLVGHSYGGATAFKIALMPKYAKRIVSLTLIEPVLPGALLSHPSDIEIYANFAQISNEICMSVLGDESEKGLADFIDFWNGPNSAAKLSPDVRSQMLKLMPKVAIDLSAIFAEEKVLASARTIGVPTLILAGASSTRVTRQIAVRLFEAMPQRRFISVANAGHMLAITHAAEVNWHVAHHLLSHSTSSAPLAA